MPISTGRIALKERGHSAGLSQATRPNSNSISSPASVRVAKRLMGRRTRCLRYCCWSHSFDPRIGGLSNVVVFSMYIAVLQCGLLVDGRLPHRDSRIRRSWVVKVLHSKPVREGGKRARDGRSTGRHSFGAAREMKTAVSFSLAPASAIPASKTGVQSCAGSCGWSR